MEPKENINIISRETRGKIEKNTELMEHVSNKGIITDLIKKAEYGTPILKLGHGDPKLMITAGIHGDELPPQIAAMWLIEDLNSKINGTLYIIPFAVPNATMKNSRRFKGFDMNRTASKSGFISNKIVNTVKKLEIDALADFHSTKPGSNPGIQSVFCSKKPCYQSYLMAEHVTNHTPSKMICHKEAGTLYKGAIEDECNLAGIPAITCEVVSKNGTVDGKSPEKSYLQMKAYLEYFKAI
ncbi:succinylglutamate desuccinylase [Methanobacterium sp.]|uniref:succinylglutamate desuccinylase n=1 Tax=Methanobacterium sp. TaxID=2164 RepID=UPI003D652456